MKIKLNSLLDDYRAMRGINALPHCAYKWGAKPGPNISPHIVYESDCSGWLEYVLKRRGFPNAFPSSSVEQGEWFKAHEDVYEKKDYSDVLEYCRHDFSRLFVCRFNLGGNARHIFLYHCGVTLECSSSLHGVSSRSADTFADEMTTVDTGCWEIPVDLT